MLEFDRDTRSMIARERQAELTRDWESAKAARPELAQSRRRPRRLRLSWLSARRSAARSAT